MLRALQRSIEHKIAAVAATAILVALMLASLAAGWREAGRRHDAKIAELQGIAAALAATVERPLAGGAVDEVRRALRAMARLPGTSYVRVSDAAGREVASFGTGILLTQSANTPAGSQALPPKVSLATYPVEVAITSAGRDIGTLTLVTDVSFLRTALLDSVGAAMLAGLLAARVGFLVVLRLQRFVSRPVLELKSAMMHVREQGDFARRVTRTSADETGELVDAFNAMLEEISSRDRALRDHRDRLEETVVERTRDLIAARRAAESANRAKSDFLATMSHEIRTPMNGLLVMAEMLASARLDAPHDRYAEIIVASGRSLLAIINDILDLSKIEAGCMQIESVPVDPAKIVDDVVHLFSARAAWSGLELAVVVEPGVPRAIRTDPVRLNQVLSNLVGNALKFTDRGRVTVTVSAQPSPKAGMGTALMRFSVRDTGVGIDASKLATIFEAFTQADPSTTRQYGGTGIGLTICRKLVMAMGGAMQVESEPGAGSTFSFTLPVPVLESQSVPGLDEARQRPAAGADGTAKSVRGARVLAADDSAVNREVLREVLARLGVDVVSVASGAEAVAAFQSGPFDLIFMDASMPDMDGFEATRRLRALERDSGRPAVPIIALTAHVIGAAATAWRDAGMNACITKPFTLHSIEACLARWLPGRGEHAEPPRPPLIHAYAADPRATQPLVDAAVLSQIAALSAEGDDLVSRVITLFTEHSRPTLASLVAAASAGDRAGVAASAHALKSMCRNIGAAKLAVLLDAIEDAARGSDRLPRAEDLAGARDTLDATLHALPQEAATVVAALRRAA